MVQGALQEIKSVKKIPGIKKNNLKRYIIKKFNLNCHSFSSGLNMFVEDESDIFLKYIARSYRRHLNCTASVAVARKIGHCDLLAAVKTSYSAPCLICWRGRA